MYDAVDGTRLLRQPYSSGSFEQSHHLCEISRALEYYALYPDEMHDLIKYLVDWEMELLEGIFTHLKPDAVLHHDDWGGERSSFMSPDMFAEFFVEPYKQIYKYCHDHGAELVIHHADSYAANLVLYDRNGY